MKVLMHLVKVLMICLLFACCTLTQSLIANNEYTDEIYLAQSDETDSEETESEDAEAEDAESEDSESESEDTSIWDDLEEWVEGRFETHCPATGGAVRG